MSENPYSAPTAPIETESFSTTRPRTILIAVCLLVLSVSAGFVHGVIQDGSPADTDGWIMLAIVLVISSVSIAIPSLLLWRLNWARWLNILIVGLSLAITPWALQDSTTDEMILYSMQLIMDLSAMILLLLPVSARWYRPNNSFKPRPLRGSA